MNRELAYRIQMFPAKVRKSRNQVHAQLMQTGWPLAVVDADLDAALSWANSHCMTQQQEKYRRNRARRAEKLKPDDALDAMFASVGADPATIPRRAGRRG